MRYILQLSFVLATIYYPHYFVLCNDRINKISFSYASTTSHEFIIAGDFNIHLDNHFDHTTL